MTKTTASTRNDVPRSLTAEEISWMRRWEGPEFLTLEIHHELEHQMRVCMSGKENAVVMGEGGLGKSSSAQVLCDKIEQEETDLGLLSGSEHTARSILRYEASRAHGTKTSLLDLWTEAAEGTPSAGMQKRSSAKMIIQEIVQLLEMRNIALIVIDEAQMIALDNLNLLRQVPDAAKAKGHKVGMILIGNPSLRSALVSLKHMGQRFSAELIFRPLTSAQWTHYAKTFHPHLAELEATMPAPEWQGLIGEMWRSTLGNFRRIEKVMINANELSLSWKRPITPEILRFALNKLAAEH